jgi:hypothetical protein
MSARASSHLDHTGIGANGVAVARADKSNKPSLI